MPKMWNSISGDIFFGQAPIMVHNRLFPSALSGLFCGSYSWLVRRTMTYSYRNATIGSTLDARRAGR